MSNNPQPQAIRLSADEIAALMLLAEMTGSIAPTGQNAGKPSWRTLVKRIAMGEIKVNHGQ